MPDSRNFFTGKRDQGNIFFRDHYISKTVVKGHINL